jgi:hypothetical protein
MSDDPSSGQNWQSGDSGINGGSSSDFDPPPTWEGSRQQAPPPPAAGFGVPAARPIDRLRMAYQGRHESDYIAHFWSALGWGILTFGIFYLYMFYQLIRRIRDHNVRRLEELDAANGYAWEVAGQRGLQEELRPNFQRASAGLENLRLLNSQLKEPTVWLAILIGAQVFTYFGGFIVYFIVYCGLDGDLIKHDSAEGAVEAELATIYSRLGQPVSQPDPARVKGPHNYAGRIVATIFSLGFYNLWWTYNMMNEPNRHFEINWVWEDSLAQAAQALQP